MCSNNDVDGSFFKALQNITTLFTSDAVREHFHAQRAATEEIFCVGHHETF